MKSLGKYKTYNVYDRQITARGQAAVVLLPLGVCKKRCSRKTVPVLHRHAINRENNKFLFTPFLQRRKRFVELDWHKTACPLLKHWDTEYRDYRLHVV